MGSTTRKPWARDELKTVLSLYVQLPFGQMDARNPEVVQVANRIERTPSAVALKLVNFASLDPAHQRRGVKGMSNTSALDRSIWSEFYGRWDVLADCLPTQVDRIEDASPETDALAIVTARRRQSFFRRAVLSAYGFRCCITGIDSPELLRASHIIPWNRREDTRLAPDNGLALNALHDVAFDRGLITIDPDGRVRTSKRLQNSLDSSNYDTYFRRYNGQPITPPERFAPRAEFLEYHRRSVFQQGG